MGCALGAVSVCNEIHSHYLVFVSQLGCCCGSAACSLCCGCCPSTRNSTVTRFAYGVLLLIGMIVSWIFLTPGLANALTKVRRSVRGKKKFLLRFFSNQIPALCKGSTFDGKLACDQIVGYLSVYRIQFAFACFFFLMMMIMLCVRRSTDPRSGIQNG